MNQHPSVTDYARAHGLARKYGLGAVYVAFIAIGAAITGDQASLIAIKTIAAIPLAVAMVLLSAVFHPERSRTPFTPSFLERTALEGVLIAVGVALFTWAPDHAPIRTIVTTLLTAVIYFAGICLLARLRRS